MTEETQEQVIADEQEHTDAADAEIASSEKTTDESGESSTPKSEGSQGFQKRIDEITRARREAEHRAEYWQKVAENGVSYQKPDKTIDDFGGDERQYQDYLRSEIVKDSVAAAKRELMADQARIRQEEVNRNFSSKEKEFAKEHEDYLNVTRREDLPYTASMHEIVSMLDNGPEIVYHLAKNSDIADRISRLPPNLQAVELTRLDAKLTKPSGSHITGAPEPIPKIKGSNAQGYISASSPDSDKLSADEWLRRRRKEIAK
jgi:hypothetical protein